MSQEAHISPSISLPASPQRRTLRDRLIAINTQHEQVFSEMRPAPSISELAEGICSLQPTGLAGWEKHLPELQKRLGSPLRTSVHDTPIESTILAICQEFRRDIPEGADILEKALARTVGVPDPQDLLTMKKLPATPPIHAYYLALRTKEEQASPGTHATLYAEQSRELQQPLAKSLLNLSRSEFTMRAADLLQTTINIGSMILGESAKDLLTYRFYTELKGPVSAAIAHCVLEGRVRPEIEQYLPSVRMDQLGADIVQLHVASDTLTGVTSVKSNKRRIPIPTLAAYHAGTSVDVSGHVQPVTDKAGKHVGYSYFVPMMVTAQGIQALPVTLEGVTYYQPTFDANGHFTNPFKTRPKDLMPCPVRLTEDVYRSITEPVQILEVHRGGTTVIAIAVNYGQFEQAQATDKDYKNRAGALLTLFYDFKESLKPQPTVMN